MNRSCFLCQHPVEPLFTTRWAVPGLDFKEIGISICSTCGSVCQSPSVSFEDMKTYYQTLAVYTNPGRNDEPTPAKVRDLDEQIQFVVRGAGHLPERVLQIGSSDGYTLSRFRQAGAQTVLGVEPGSESVKLASEKYDVPCFQGVFEDFEPEHPFELIVLTHVLEHFYHPSKVLERCFELQRPLKEGFLFAEVPLLTHPELLCPGFFSFEHINYYSQITLTESLQRAGYGILSWNVHLKSDASPVVGVLATTQNRLPKTEFENNYDRHRKWVLDFRKLELERWQACVDRVLAPLKCAKRVYLWGAGIHTSQLLADTNLLEHVSIDGLVDTSPLKWNVKQGDWVCMNPFEHKWSNGDAVLISSYMSEKEIYDAIQWLRDLGVSTLRLHNVDDTRALS